MRHYSWLDPESATFREKIILKSVSTSVAFQRGFSQFVPVFAAAAAAAAAAAVVAAVAVVAVVAVVAGNKTRWDSR